MCKPEEFGEQGGWENIGLLHFMREYKNPAKERAKATPSFTKTGLMSFLSFTILRISTLIIIKSQAKTKR